MIMARPSDLMLRAYSPSTRIQLIHVDVVDSARTLEQGHLCGPTASLALAETLAGVALLSAELTRPQETVTLRMRVSGPVRGVLVEASQDGGLRGYTNVKVMNELDCREELDSSEAFGEQGEVQIIRSLPGRILSHATLQTQPASVRLAIEQYYTQSLQRRALAQIVAIAYGGTLDCARGLLAFAMPDTDAAVFDRLAGVFGDDVLADELEACGSLSDLGETLGFQDLQYEPPRSLSFACRCSPSRVESMLEALSLSELAAMVAQDKPASVFCHMCGKGYEVKVSALQEMLARRQK